MRGRRRERLRLTADINVVSLIDVMLLLLVIFMLTAPMMTGGLDLTLPSAAARPLETKSGLSVTIDRSHNIYVNDTKMTFSQFKGSFEVIAKAQGKGGVDVYIDKSIPYGEAVQVLSVIRAAGIDNTGLVLEPQEVIK